MRKSACCEMPKYGDRDNLRLESIKSASDLSTDPTASSSSFESFTDYFSDEMKEKDYRVCGSQSKLSKEETKRLDPIFSSDETKSRSMKPDGAMRQLLLSGLDERNAHAESDDLSASGDSSDDGPEAFYSNDSPQSKSTEKALGGTASSSSDCTGFTNRPSVTSSSSKLSELLASFTHIVISSDSEKDEEEEEEDDDDDFSVDDFSDLTGFTGAVSAPTTGLSPIKVHKLNVLVEGIPARKQTVSRVIFGQVFVRKYEQILCDNPACSCGPAIGIGWEYKVASKATSVNDYEAYRKKRGVQKGTELVLTREERLAIVKKLGYEKKEIAGMIRSILKIRNQRRQTINNLGVQKVEEAVEKVGRKVKKIFLLAKKAESGETGVGLKLEI